VKKACFQQESVKWRFPKAARANHFGAGEQ
jgi:hypothetical protein